MGERVLIVDDDKSVLFVLGNVLKKVGDHQPIEIVTAQDGQQALERFQQEEFDLVIMDLRLPGIDGVRLTEAIRRSDSDVIVIWITAYDCYKASPDARRLSVYRCLDKPLEIEEIRATVREALEEAGARNEVTK
jgi:DNA-binding NtrC family response regulator